jgi:integrase/recombinase XerC
VCTTLPRPASAAARAGHSAAPGDLELFPNWFVQFLDDRQTRKPSAHTMKGYRQDFATIAFLVTDSNPERLTVADITKDSMRQAFAAYARDHEAASTRRYWSNWNVWARGRGLHQVDRSDVSFRAPLVMGGFYARATRPPQ